MYPQTHLKINLPIHLGAISFWLTTKVGCFLRPVNEDGYIKVNDQEDSATWLIIVPVHAFIPDSCKDLSIHSHNVLHIIYLSMSVLTLQLTMLANLMFTDLFVDVHRSIHS